MKKTNGSGIALLAQAVVQSWLAWGLLWGYVILQVAQEPPDPLWSGGLALGAILLAMNGLARTELWWTAKSPEWFRTHPLARRFHHLHNEGELAGIFVAGIVLVCQLLRHAHPHFALVEAFTLLGIMSAANVAVSRMMPIMEAVERFSGKWGAIVIGSLLSSFTGEPSAAVFLSEYFRGRTSADQKNRVATGLGATIGSGGGLLPFSAPPVLIVWAILGREFGWGLGHLLLFVGGACVLHVAVVAWRLRDAIGAYQPSSTTQKTTLVSWWPLVLLAGVVGLNMTFEFHHQRLLTWGIDALVAVWALVVSYRDNPDTAADERLIPAHQHEHPHGESSGRWQPVTLGLLLMGLEVVGMEAEPLLQAMAAFIPATAPALLIILVLWLLSAVTSHFADNALASRVYITVAVTLSGVIGYGDLLAMAVVLGALFGGFLLIPANLPNFAISKKFGVTPGGWASTAWRWYWSGVVHVVWITTWYYFS